MDEVSFDLPALIDDELLTPEIKMHSLDKYRVIRYFLNIFSKSMKNRWNNRVYIDLFASAGRSRVENENKIVPGSPLLALGVDVKFDKYIFCEKDPLYANVLEKRVSKICEKNKYKIIRGDVNENVTSILKEIPKFGKGNTCLSFCLADPYRISDLKFETIQKLSQSLRVDFLILIPSSMDIRRNERIYIDSEEVTLDNFLGDQNWRDGWQKKKATTNSDFGLYVLNYFCEKMKNLGYIYDGLNETKTVFLKSKNLSLYHLAYFSKSELGYEFWEDTKNYTNPQTGFDFEGI